MISKDELRKKFSKEYKKHYEVEFFRREGFIRKKCPICGRYFWTLDPDRKYCGEPPCGSYEFIGNPPTKVKYDYIGMWRFFADYFKKMGHTEIKRYPVVARWRDDLYFTIASISNFQPFVVRGEVDPPANPLIVPQVCLRFGDVSNVGITGRHFTSFIMGGQHAFNKKDKVIYWKNETLEMNFKFLTEWLGIPKEEIVAKEDVWAGGGNFGPSMEYFARGLEIVNQVFMQFELTPDGPKELSTKVIDVGWGHERLVWISNGTPTAYDSVFGPVMDKLLSHSNIEIDKDLFIRYAKLAGNLDVTEIKDINLAWNNIAKQLSVDVDTLKKTVAPLQALYAIGDHVRTLVFAITDGALPSNVGGGYNLRVVLRRALSFLRKYHFDFTLHDVAWWHIQYLKGLFPELEEAYDDIVKIFDVEIDRFDKTYARAMRIVSNLLKREKEIRPKRWRELYISHGITPEVVQEVVERENVSIKIPPNVYELITEKDEVPIKKVEEERKVPIETRLIEELPPTKQLYYEDAYIKEFDAKVLRIFERNGKKYVVLDQTAFYPEGGGQPADVGLINASSVIDTQKVGQVIFHIMNDISFKEGDIVHGKIDWSRRSQLMRNHTATHILLGAARKILGRHVWQWGSQLDPKISRLDITHYQTLSLDEIEKIERLVNQVIMENRKVITKFMDRRKAEDTYGFRLYQGGIVPGKIIRILEVEDWDVEACGGTHVRNTGDIGVFRIVRVKRIQDGVVRIEYAVGTSAVELMQKDRRLLHDASNILRVEPEKLVSTVKRFFEEWKALKKELDRTRAELILLKVNESLEKELQEVNGAFYLIKMLNVRNPKELIEFGNYIQKNDNKPILAILLAKVGESLRYVIVATPLIIQRGLNIEKISRQISSLLNGGIGKVSERLYQGGTKHTKELDKKLDEISQYIKKELVTL
ncbi:MAG: alanine--tRNA ligase [Candidatus Asgardarchaeia archaeon]